MLEFKVTYNIAEVVVITYTEHDMLSSLKVGNQAIGDMTTLTYGPLAQYGSFSVFDKDYAVSNMLFDGTLLSDDVIKVEIFMEGEYIGNYEATLEYNFETCEISFSLVDSISRWNEVIYPGFTFFEVYNASSKPAGGSIYGGAISGDMHIGMLTAEEVFNRLKTFTENYGELFETLSTNTLSWFQSIKVYVPYFEPCTLESAWIQFCTLTFTHLYKGADGKIRVVYYDE